MTPPQLLRRGVIWPERRFAISFLSMIFSENRYPLFRIMLSIALARRLFFESGHVRALRQRSLDFLKPHTARLQQHQQVKQQVRAFGDQMVAIVLDRGDHGFDRLLAEFLGAMLRSLVQELARIGRLYSRWRARIGGGCEILKREARHQLNSRARRVGRYPSHLALL